MNGPQDIGGMQGTGEILFEEDEPVFHSEWEAKVFAMSFATFGNYFTVDETRHAAERMPAGRYLSSQYYERWLYALELLLADHNWLTATEIEEKIAQMKLAERPVEKSADS